MIDWKGIPGNEKRAEKRKRLISMIFTDRFITRPTISLTVVLIPQEAQGLPPLFQHCPWKKGGPQTTLYQAKLKVGKLSMEQMSFISSTKCLNKWREIEFAWNSFKIPIVMDKKKACHIL